MQTISEDFLETYLKPQPGVPWVETLTRILQLSKDFQETLPLTHKAYFARLMALSQQNQLLYQLAFELGGTMFDIYHKFYGGFWLPERKGLWDENNLKASKILRTLHRRARPTMKKRRKTFRPSSDRIFSSASLCSAPRRLPQRIPSSACMKSVGAWRRSRRN